jgi:hypothetical protein
MEAMREAWTDERLDDLTNRMDQGFARVDGDMRDLRVEMNSRFNHLDANFNGLQRTIIQVGGGLIGTMLVASAGLIATRL